MFHLNQQIDECEAYLSKYNSINISEATVAAASTDLKSWSLDRTDSFPNLLKSPSTTNCNAIFISGSGGGGASSGKGNVIGASSPTSIISSSLTSSNSPTSSLQSRHGGGGSSTFVNQHRRMHSFPNIQINMAKKSELQQQQQQNEEKNVSFEFREVSSKLK